MILDIYHPKSHQTDAALTKLKLEHFLMVSFILFNSTHVFISLSHYQIGTLYFWTSFYRLVSFPFEVCFNRSSAMEVPYIGQSCPPNTFRGVASGEVGTKPFTHGPSVDCCRIPVSDHVSSVASRPKIEVACMRERNNFRACALHSCPNFAPSYTKNRRRYEISYEISLTFVL